MSKVAHLEALVACITQTEATLPDLDRAVIVAGIGAELVENLREDLVRLRVMVQRVAQGHLNQQKATKPANGSKVPALNSQL